MSSLKEAAYKYHAAGMNVLAAIVENESVDGAMKRKIRPVEAWTVWQEKRQTPRDIDRMFSTKDATIGGIICGKISGGLEVIDIDVKNDPAGTICDLVWADIVDAFASKRLPCVPVRTRSGGMHLYYRCDTIEGNQVLAYALHEKGKRAIIETRAEKGFIVAPPTEGYSEYDAQIVDMPRIEEHERDMLMDICRKYNQVFEDAPKKPSAIRSYSYAVTPWDAYNEDPDEPWRQVMADAGWEPTGSNKIKEYWTMSGSDNANKGNWNYEKRLFYLFSTTADIPGGKAYTPFALYANLVCAGDYSAAAAKLRSAGYGRAFSEAEERIIVKAAGYLDKGLTLLDIMDRLSVEYEQANEDLKDVAKEERDQKVRAGVEQLVNTAADRIAVERGVFWTITKKGVVVSTTGLINFLRLHGFRLYSQTLDSALYRVVHIDPTTHIIEETPTDVVMKWVERWARTHTDDYDISLDQLLEAIMLYKEWGHVIQWMPRVTIADIQFLRDTRSKSFVPFRNGIVWITADDMDIMEYSDLPEGVMVWRNQIKDVDIELPPIATESNLNACAVYKYMKRISGITPDLNDIALSDLQISHPDLHKKFMAFISSAGYLMNNYKDPARTPAIILAEDTPSEKDGGGAGKDLYVKCLMPIRSVCELPGKTWEPGKNFAFQSYKMGDDIMYISDLKPRFVLQDSYNLITEGVLVERKNKDAFMVPFELSPKVVMSTNYDIDTTAGHAARRVRKLLLARWYSVEYGPKDEFGCQFFSEDWDRDDWMLYYAFMFTCIQVFLEGGIVQFDETVNMKIKGVKLRYSEEFYEFMKDWVVENTGRWVVQKEMYDQFLYDSGQEKKEYSHKRFAHAVANWAQVWGMGYGKKRGSARNSNGRDEIFVILQSQGKDIQELDEYQAFATK